MKKVIILLYHRILKDDLVDEKEFQKSYAKALYLYFRKESQFINDMEYLKESGCEIISLYDLLKVKNTEKKISSNAAIITFDDGDKSNYNIAFPVLKRYGFKATFFIITGKVGKEGYMSWDELREMADCKDERNEKLFDVESHTHTHLALALRKEEKDDNYYRRRIMWELKTAQGVINKEIKRMPKFLALPAGSGGGKGKNDKLIRKLAKQCGYLGIRTSNSGIISHSSDIYKLNVFPVLNRTDISGIRIWLKYSFLIFPWRVINKTKAFLNI